MGEGSVSPSLGWESEPPAGCFDRLCDTPPEPVSLLDQDGDAVFVFWMPLVFHVMDDKGLLLLSLCCSAVHNVSVIFACKAERLLRSGVYLQLHNINDHFKLLWEDAGLSIEVLVTLNWRELTSEAEVKILPLSGIEPGSSVREKSTLTTTPPGLQRYSFQRNSFQQNSL